MLSLGDLILSGLLQFVWILFIQGPLQLIAIGSIAIQYLSGGLQWIVFFNAKVSVVDGMIQPPGWEQIQIPYPFIGMLVVGLVIGLVIFVIIMTKNYASGMYDTKTPLSAKIGSTVKLAIACLMTSLAIPVGYFILTILLTFFIGAITKIFNGAGANLADYLYTAGYFGDPDFVPEVPQDYSPPGNWDILQYNMLIQIIVVFMSLLGVLIIGWMISVKTIELAFLYFSGPIIACSMISDGGKKMTTWKDMVLSKNCVIVANYMGYWLFVYLVQISFNVINGVDTGNMNWLQIGILKGFLLLCFLGGAAMGTYGLSSLTAALFGDGFGVREALSTFASMSGLRMIKKGFGRFSRGVVGLGAKGAKNRNGGGGGAADDGKARSGAGKDAIGDGFKEGAAKGRGIFSTILRTSGKMLYRGAKFGVSKAIQCSSNKEYSASKADNIDTFKSFDDLENKKAQKQLSKIQKAASYGNDIAKQTLNKYSKYKDETKMQKQAEYNVKLKELEKKYKESQKGI